MLRSIGMADGRSPKREPTHTRARIQTFLDHWIIEGKLRCHVSQWNVLEICPLGSQGKNCSWSDVFLETLHYRITPGGNLVLEELPLPLPLSREPSRTSRQNPFLLCCLSGPLSLQNVRKEQLLKGSQSRQTA